MLVGGWRQELQRVGVWDQKLLVGGWCQEPQVVGLPFEPLLSSSTEAPLSLDMV